MTGLTVEDREELQNILASNRMLAPEKSRENSTFTPEYFEGIRGAVEALTGDECVNSVTAREVAAYLDENHKRIAQALGVLYRDGELERVEYSTAYRYKPRGGA